jgi:hypothetical protein
MYCTQRYTEINQDPLLFSVAQGIFFTVHRETLTQYITYKRGGKGSLCLGVTKSPKIGPLLIFSISLTVHNEK